MNPAGKQGRTSTFLLGALALCALGIFFRFYHLDRMVVWDDEIATAMRAEGLSEAELLHAAGTTSDGRTLAALIHQPPRGIRATITTLAQEEPQQAPLYYIVEAGWVSVFGSSVAMLRMVSALAGVLLLPAAAWLGWELLRSRTGAIVSLVLFAVSPFFIVYAQDARPYSLWALSLVLMHAAFLRAVRLPSARAWSLYAAVFTVASLIHAFTLAVAAGHGLMLVLSERRLVRSHLPRASAAWAFGVLCVAPWLWQSVRNAETVARGTASFTTEHRSAVTTLATFLKNVRLAFIDVGTSETSILGLALSLLGLAFIAWCAFTIARAAPDRVRSFLLWGAVVATAPVLGTDLLRHGALTLQIRYFFPWYLIVVLAIATSLTIGIESARHADAKRRWQVGIVAVIACCIISSVVRSRATTWWNSFYENAIPIAAAINRDPRPVIVGDNYLLYALTLSYYVAPDVRFVLHPRCYLCRHGTDDAGLATDFTAVRSARTVYLLGPSHELGQPGSLPVAPGVPVRCIDIRNNCINGIELFGHAFVAHQHTLL